MNMTKLYKERAYLQEYLELLKEEPVLEADKELIQSMERDLNIVEKQLRSQMNWLTLSISATCE